MERDSVDKRRFIRAKFPFTIHIYRPNKPAITTYINDISRGGIKVITRQELEVSTVVGLAVYLKKGAGKDLLCFGKVLGMTAKEAKDSLNQAEKISKGKQERKSKNYISEGIKIIK